MEKNIYIQPAVEVLKLQAMNQLLNPASKPFGDPEPGGDEITQY